MLRTLILCLTLIMPVFGIAQESEAPAPEAPAANPQVVIKTSEGDITLTLYADKAPITVENFLAYVDDGFYNGTIYHRVIPNFMIQGGGFDENLSQKSTKKAIVNESKNRLHNTRGTIAMARTSDPDSATAQFFINQRSNLSLDWAPNKPGYTVFGEVIEGMDVVDFIATAKTGQIRGMGDVPIDPILINEVVRLQPQ